MARYIITYDLKAPGRSYSELYERIKTYPYVRISESSWAVSSTRMGQEIRDYLGEVIDRNDKLVVGLLGPVTGYNLPNEVTKWLETY